MNHQLKYGYSQLGTNILVKINCKMSNQQAVELEKKFPPGIEYVIPFDTTKFVTASINEVMKTLAEAMVLVAIVVFMFLQNWRATLIPLIAVPVSLIGTFAGLWAFGFSINITILKF